VSRFVPAVTPAGGIPSTFVAWYNHGAGDSGDGSADELSAFSTRTGHLVKNLVDLGTVAKHLTLEGSDRGPTGSCGC
jgi:hypothetical protein